MTASPQLMNIKVKILGVFLVIMHHPGKASAGLKVHEYFLCSKEQFSI